MAKADSAAKTEKPTPKKIKEGVKQGQVARTTDLAAWTGLLALTLLTPFMLELLTEQLRALLLTLPDMAQEPTPERLGSIALPAVISIA
ncbi:MAG: EscU/YscU/HrcU family type III secretion system export apparatus switch protein, partial [Candidatus Nanopelagicales bacterium]